MNSVAQTTTYANSIASNLWGSLASNSPAYSRPGSSDLYYYDAIQVTVRVSGVYSFRSISDIDAYGYMYLNSFNPSRPADNLLTIDDDSGDYRQFLIKIGLASSNTYVLVVTTYSPGSTTMFVVTGLGPARVNYARLNTTPTSTPSIQSRPTTQTRPISQTSSGTQSGSTTQTPLSTATAAGTPPPISCKFFLK